MHDLTPPLTSPRPEGGKKPVVLTIAGFDPSGGAGILADVRTIQSLGCRAVAAVTSITFQNSNAYFGAVHQTAETLRAQVVAIAAEHQIAAVKIGMLPTAESVREVARLIRECNLPAPVVDPVMESTTGGKLMADDAYEVFVTELLPLARLVTPNVPEAEKLAGVNIESEAQMPQAAARIRELGARAVLIKGGHLKQSGFRVQESGENKREAVDLLDDEGQETVFRSEWIDARTVRGTGCMLSSAVAAGLAKQLGLADAVKAAKDHVLVQMQSSRLKN